MAIMLGIFWCTVYQVVMYLLAVITDNNRMESEKKIKNNLGSVSGSLEIGVSSKESDFESKKISFNEDGLRNILKLSDVLKGIHLRLIADGYVIKDGKIHFPQLPHGQR